MSSNRLSIVRQPTIAVLVLCTNEKHFLGECLDSLRQQTWKNVSVYLLDNSSKDGSPEFVEENYPEVQVMRFSSNLGYAKANNRGFERAFADGADFCLVLNSDVKADPRMIESLLASFQRAAGRGKKVGLLQPTILLYDEPQKLNTVGNAMHYLGFGFCKDYLKKYSPLAADNDITSVSGAAMFVSRHFYEDVGGFDEDFFLYNEDQNLSWRGMMRGYNNVVSADAILFHKYSFHRRPFKMYHSEKNRLMMVLENYSLKTLLVIAPMFLFCELMVIVHSLRFSWWQAKLKGYVYVLRSIPHVLAKRRMIQERRIETDRRLLEDFAAELEFAVFDNAVLRFFVNPILRYYHSFLLKLV